jgi:hypothetical protein
MFTISDHFFMKLLVRRADLTMESMESMELAAPEEFNLLHVLHALHGGIILLERKVAKIIFKGKSVNILIFYL